MKTTKKKKTTNRQLAVQIADFLFTNGMGERAERLQMVMKDLSNGGGWSKSAVAYQIETILNESAPPVTGTKESE